MKQIRVSILFRVLAAGLLVSSPLGPVPQAWADEYSQNPNNLITATQAIGSSQIAQAQTEVSGQPATAQTTTTQNTPAAGGQGTASSAGAQYATDTTTFGASTVNASAAKNLNNLSTLLGTAQASSTGSQDSSSTPITAQTVTGLISQIEGDLPNSNSQEGQSSNNSGFPGWLTSVANELNSASPGSLSTQNLQQIYDTVVSMGQTYVQATSAFSLMGLVGSTNSGDALENFNQLLGLGTQVIGQILSSQGGTQNGSSSTLSDLVSAFTQAATADQTLATDDVMTLETPLEVVGVYPVYQQGGNNNLASMLAVYAENGGSADANQGSGSNAPIYINQPQAPTEATLQKARNSVYEMGSDAMEMDTMSSDVSNLIKMDSTNLATAGSSANSSNSDSSSLDDAVGQIGSEAGEAVGTELETSTMDIGRANYEESQAQSKLSPGVTMSDVAQALTYTPGQTASASTLADVAAVNANPQDLLDYTASTDAAGLERSDIDAEGEAVNELTNLGTEAVADASKANNSAVTNTAVSVFDDAATTVENEMAPMGSSSGQSANNVVFGGMAVIDQSLQPGVQAQASASLQNAEALSGILNDDTNMAASTIDGQFNVADNLINTIGGALGQLTAAVPVLGSAVSAVADATSSLFSGASQAVSETARNADAATNLAQQAAGNALIGLNGLGSQATTSVIDAVYQALHYSDELVGGVQYNPSVDGSNPSLPGYASDDEAASNQYLQTLGKLYGNFIGQAEDNPSATAVNSAIQTLENTVGGNTSALTGYSNGELDDLEGFYGDGTNGIVPETIDAILQGNNGSLSALQAAVDQYNTLDQTALQNLVQQFSNSIN